MNEPESKKYFYRRCHSCWETTLQDNKNVEKCNFCGKYFVPFFYFDQESQILIDDTKNTSFSRRELGNESDSESKGQKNFYNLQGLTAFWGKEVIE